MTGLDWLAPKRLPFRGEVLKEMLYGIEASIDRRGSAVGRTLVLNKVGHVTPRDRTRVLGDRREKQAEIPPIVVYGMGGRIPSLQIGPEEGDRIIGHRLVSSEGLALGNRDHGLVVLLPFGGIVELGIAQGLV
jgi:hypothetical protein